MLCLKKEQSLTEDNITGYILICTFIFWLLSAFAYVDAKRRNALFCSDIWLPAFPVVFWMFLIELSYADHNLVYYIEIPIILVASLIILYLRVFFIDKHKLNFRYNSYMVVGASLLFVILFKTFMTLELIHLIFR